MVTRQPRYSKEEFARRGNEIYERVIRPVVEAGNQGKFVAVDIETGEREMDSDALAACDQLIARIPDLSDLAGQSRLSLCPSGAVRLKRVARNSNV